MKNLATYLVSMLAIVFAGIDANAQGGTTPLVGSTHTYSVTVGSAGNTKAWTISPGTSGSEYILTGGSAATASITWNTAGTYTVTFTETDPVTLCSTVKNISVVVGSNTFDVSTSSPTAFCNSASGLVNNSDPDAVTSVSFVVNMATGISTFNPVWEIKFTLTPGTAAISNVSGSDGTLTESAGVYTLTAIPSASGTGTVNISLDVTGSKITTQSVLLTITSARELTYNTPDVDNTDWTATQVVSAVPNTSDITAN